MRIGFRAECHREHRHKKFHVPPEARGIGYWKFTVPRRTKPSAECGMWSAECLACGLTPAEISPMWQTAPPRKPVSEAALKWQAAAMSIAILAHGCHRQGMKTLTMKVPDGLLGWLEN